jgi:hypothetical protein
LIDLFETTFFQSGLRFGLIALVAGFLITLTIRRSRPAPIGGLLILAGVLAAFWRLEEFGWAPLFPLGLILVGVAVMRLPKASDGLVALASIPGAIWLALSTEVTNLSWVRTAIAVLIPLGGYLLTDFESRYSGMGLGVVFYMLATVGVFLAVPDTEWALVLIAVVIPVTFLAWPQVRIRLGTEGIYAALAIFLLVTAQGGEPRPASIVGGFACLGLLLLEPIVMQLRPSIVRVTSWPRRDWKGAIVASVPQLVVVAVCSRIAARFTNELPALIIVAVIYAVVAMIAVTASREPVSRVG